MKKKLFALLISAAMLVSMAACGGGSSSETPASTAEPTAVAAEDSTESETEDADEADDGAEEVAENTGSADVPGDASQSDWPTDIVNLYVPATAGGGTDMLGRLFAQAMTEETDGTYIVVNDMTGGGTVAAETVRNANTDGHELLLYHTGMCSMIATGQYDKSITDDFTVLGLATSEGGEEAGVYVSADSDFDTLDDLIEYAKANPGELIAGVQVGGATQFMQALFDNSLGIETTMVEAGANADRITGIIGGSLDMSIIVNSGTDQYVASGDLKCLAQVGSASKLLPDVPTFEELGYEPCYMGLLLFVLGPKGMDENDVAKISESMKLASENQTLIDGYAQMETPWNYTTPAESVEYIERYQQQYNEAYELLVSLGLV